MYVIVGKRNCIQCDELKNLLDEKGIQHNYLEMAEQNDALFENAL